MIVSVSLISFFVGGVFGVIGMSILSSNAYQKGFKDGRGQYDE